MNDKEDFISLPQYAVDLVDLLDKQFPAAPPNINDPDRVIWHKAGQRSVVDFLLSLKKQLEEDQGD